MNSHSIDAAELQNEVTRLGKNIQNYIYNQLEAGLIQPNRNDISQYIIQYLDTIYFPKNAKDGIVPKLYTEAAKELITQIRSGKALLDVKYQEVQYLPFYLMPTLDPSAEDLMSDKDYELLLKRVDALSNRTKPRSKNHQPFILEDLECEDAVLLFKNAMDNLVKCYGSITMFPRERAVNKETTEVLNKRKMREMPQLSRIHADFPDESNKIFDQMSLLKNNEIKVLQIEISDLKDHQLLLHITYDKNTDTYNMICFDSSRDVSQAIFLENFAKECESKKIKFNIIACQGYLQNDYTNCGIYVQTVANELLKNPQIDLSSAKAIPQPKFMYNVGLQDYSKIEGVKWVDVSEFPEKVLLSAQSFNRMKEILQSKYPNDPDKIENIIKNYQILYGHNDANNYIAQRRANLSTHLAALEQDVQAFQIQQEIKPDKELLQKLINQWKSKLEISKNEKDINFTNKLTKLHQEIDQCQSVLDLKKITQRLTHIVDEYSVTKFFIFSKVDETLPNDLKNTLKQSKHLSPK